MWEGLLSCDIGWLISSQLTANIVDVDMLLLVDLMILNAVLMIQLIPKSAHPSHKADALSAHHLLDQKQIYHVTFLL